MTDGIYVEIARDTKKSGYCHISGYHTGSLCLKDSHTNMGLHTH